ncbi:MAG: hypothetical protein HY078_08290 [Elusimicrobia bacterium]|nr:hypothetical protein [Elusimicrobiota bacterium]
MRTAILLAAAVLLGATASDAAPKLEPRCGASASGIPWTYCILEVPGGSRDVVYLLHGGGDNEKSLFKEGLTDELLKTWKMDGFPPPILVSVSFGKFWMLTGSDAAPRSGLLETFTGSVIPHVESELLEGPIGRRQLFGYSMGGLNATVLVLRAPELFSRGAAACPAYLGVSPFSTAEALARYVEERRADPKRISMIVDLAKAHVADEEAWRRFSPPAASSLLGPRTPPMHVSCGDRDHDFYREARDFASAARGRGAPVEWQRLSGGHCVMDFEAIARFLERR